MIIFLYSCCQFTYFFCLNEKISSRQRQAILMNCNYSVWRLNDDCVRGRVHDCSLHAHVIYHDVNVLHALCAIHHTSFDILLLIQSYLRSCYIHRMIIFYIHHLHGHDTNVQCRQNRPLSHFLKRIWAEHMHVNYLLERKMLQLTLSLHLSLCI